MSNEEFDRIEDVLKSFPDLELTRSLYTNSGLFHKCVMMLARGMSYQEVIMRLIEVTDDVHKALQYQLLTAPPRPINFTDMDNLYNKNKPK